eukprot:g5182.t1
MESGDSNALNEEPKKPAPAKGKSYVEEQQALKDNFHAAISDSDSSSSSEDEDGGLFVVKKATLLEENKSTVSMNVDDKPLEMEVPKESKKTKKEKDEEFLQNFISQRQWEDMDNLRTPSYGHSRHVEGSLRRKKDKRKKNRELRQARKEKEKEKKREELKRLKNLKRKEIAAKLKEIELITGSDAAVDVSNIDLEGDWDPDAYDKQMSSMFNDEYYNHEDTQFGAKGDYKENEVVLAVDDDLAYAPLAEAGGTSGGCFSLKNIAPYRQDQAFIHGDQRRRFLKKWREAEKEREKEREEKRAAEAAAKRAAKGIKKRKRGRRGKKKKTAEGNGDDVTLG